jgi:hypothetical protein
MTNTARFVTMAVVILALCRTATGAGLPPIPTVGVEGAATLEIPGPRLFVVQRDRDALLYPWIAGVKKNGASFTYDFRYIGMKAGTHNLLYYLRYQDGSSPARLKQKVSVEVGSALEEGHAGYLTRIRPAPIRLFTWYREIVAGVVILWGILLVPLIFAGRGAKEEGVPVVVPLSLADRLRPLVVKAADGELTLGEKALFERLLLGYWCGRLDLDPKEILESLVVLRKHDVAGKLICSVESFLHKPMGADSVDIAALLEPYKNIFDEEGALA